MSRKTILATIVTAALTLAAVSAATSALPVICRDGTASPQCHTTDASLSGCCSGHGGVRR